jgi:hypothetical protein
LNINEPAAAIEILNLEQVCLQWRRISMAAAGKKHFFQWVSIKRSVEVNFLFGRIEMKSAKRHDTHSTSLAM